MAEKKEVNLPVRKFGAFSSSADPEKLSVTWTGVAGAFVTVLVYLAPHIGLDLSQIDFNQLIQAGGEMITSAMAVVSAGAIVWGGARKIYYAILNRNK